MSVLSRQALVAIARRSLKWLLLASAVGVLAGAASTLFLFALDWATGSRLAHPWLLYLLPLAGFVVGWVYLHVGQGVEAGNNLLIDEIHEPRAVLPLRMAPLVLISTVVSHLFGASVGREGTAVQMGGALADQLSPVFRLEARERRLLLMAGISAGFASVFGTPLAALLFGVEVLAIGALRYAGLLPCLVAAVVADQVSLLLGVQHSHYGLAQLPPFSFWSVSAVIIAGALFGLCARLFARLTHALGAWFKRRLAYAPLRPLFGGLVIALCASAFGAERFLGLGLTGIAAAFEQPVPTWDFAGKMAWTVLSLGSGFKGGEVTPLFYIGATLGNALAPVLDLPVSLLAGLGFVAVFGGAANTPLAATMMAMELFGIEIGAYAALACLLSYLCSGHTGIYRAQRVERPKHPFRRRAKPASGASEPPA